MDTVNHVTEFYTYRSTMLDQMRAIAERDSVSEKIDVANRMLYMQFLMFESARRAIDDLVEFEPKKVEEIIEILCSELTLYGYLRSVYQDDYHNARLILRNYDFVPELCDLASSYPNANWKKAKALTPELLNRYNHMRETIRRLQT